MKRGKLHGELVLAVVIVATACGGEGDDLFEASGGAGGSTTATGGGSSSQQGTGGGGGAAETTGQGGEGPVCVDLGEPCTACELDACPDTYCECYGNPSCGMLAQCAYACPPNDEACLQECFSNNPDGITDAALLTHCAATECEVECPGYVPLTPCQQCLYQSCEPQMNACVAIADCTALLYCLDGCAGNMVCENGCYASYPTVLNEVYAVGTCAQAECPSSCG